MTEQDAREPRTDEQTDDTIERLRIHGPADPRAVVLMLHGGQQRSTDPVLRRHASWWRMALVQDAVDGSVHEHGVATWLLRNRVRGWNAELTRVHGGEPSPVADAREALDAIAHRHPGRPVVLVGHSMGGRSACHVADHPAVVGVCALAPWLPTGEPVDALRDRRLDVVHGDRDRWTSAAQSRAYVERARAVATEATWESMPSAGHFMLSRRSDWNTFVRRSVARTLDLA